jgi:hypothetical protein
MTRENILSHIHNVIIFSMLKINLKLYLQCKQHIFVLN